MARTDGFPTNREIQVDFTSVARDAFVAAAERELESKISLVPAFEDKPLDHLTLTFAQTHEVGEDTTQSIYAERLVISPLQMSTVEDLKYEKPDKYTKFGNELFRDVSDDVIEHYKLLASAIGEIVITDNLCFRQLTPSAVEADWTAYRDRSGYSTRHASTFRERASKQSLVSAKFFAEDALSYTKSDIFDKPAAVRMADFLLSYGGNPQYMMTHQFNFIITPDLPLNGHESQRFIKSYAERMAHSIDISTSRLERMESLGAPKIIIDNAREKVARYTAALANATPHLK